MNNWLLFLLKSTMILSLLYLFFRLLMRKEAFFKLSRIDVAIYRVASVIIPFISLPQPIHPLAQLNWIPFFRRIQLLKSLFRQMKSLFQFTHLNQLQIPSSQLLFQPETIC